MEDPSTKIRENLANYVGNLVLRQIELETVLNQKEQEIQSLRKGPPDVEDA